MPFTLFTKFKQISDENVLETRNTMIDNQNYSLKSYKNVRFQDIKTTKSLYMQQESSCKRKEWRESWGGHLGLATVIPDLLLWCKKWSF